MCVCVAQFPGIEAISITGDPTLLLWLVRSGGAAARRMSHLVAASHAPRRAAQSLLPLGRIYLTMRRKMHNSALQGSRGQFISYLMGFKCAAGPSGG